MSVTLDDILNSHHTNRPIVMGILNVTPDSFSDGGLFETAAAAIEHAGVLLANGADVIDIGAESTRPGSQRVPAARQIERLQEILPAVAAGDAIVSVDTTRASVAEFALDAGAAIINDVSAGRDDPDLLAMAAERNAPVVLMHMLGEPKTMQQQPKYDNVLDEVKAFLAGRLAAAAAAGLPAEHCIVDPGIGFGKTLEHNLALLGGISLLCELGAAVLVGPSRKRFIGELVGEQTPAGNPVDRLGGTIAACLAAFSGGATIFRVHDVAPVRQALTTATTIANHHK